MKSSDYHARNVKRDRYTNYLLHPHYYSNKRSYRSGNNISVSFRPIFHDLVLVLRFWAAGTNVRALYRNRKPRETLWRPQVVVDDFQTCFHLKKPFASTRDIYYTNIKANKSSTRIADPEMGVILN